jgi:hypothetical protein
MSIRVTAGEWGIVAAGSGVVLTGFSVWMSRLYRQSSIVRDAILGIRDKDSGFTKPGLVKQVEDMKGEYDARFDAMKDTVDKVATRTEMLEPARIANIESNIAGIHTVMRTVQGQVDMVRSMQADGAHRAIEERGALRERLDRMEDQFKRIDTVEEAVKQMQKGTQ